MARVTIEDCLANIDNAFDIVTLASRRAKDLIDGSEPLVDCKDKPTVVALREIAAAEVGMDYFKTSSKEKIDNKLQDAITEEEIISEINQNYNVTNQENLTEVFEDQDLSQVWFMVEKINLKRSLFLRKIWSKLQNWQDFQLKLLKYHCLEVT